MKKFKAGDKLFSNKKVRKENPTYDSPMQFFDLIEEKYFKNVKTTREGEICKKKFRIAVCCDDDKKLDFICQTLHKVGYRDVTKVKSPTTMLRHGNQSTFDLVLTKYDFYDHYNGIDIFDALHMKKDGHKIMGVCIVNGYNPKQYMEIKRSGAHVINCFPDYEAKEIFADCFLTIAKSYYLFYLIDGVFGLGKSIEFKQRKFPVNYTINELEQMLAQKFQEAA